MSMSWMASAFVANLTLIAAHHGIRSGRDCLENSGAYLLRLKQARL